MRKRDLLFLIIFTFLVKANPQNITFGHLSLEDGLSNNSVNCLLQDHYGFLWFGTDDGLNRFDGYQIRIFRNDPGDTHSLSDNSIYSVFEDRAGFLWIGTNNGDLNRYDQKADKFEHWNIESQKVFKGSSQKENRITCIYEDKHGLFWIGTYKNGLYRFNPSENNFSHWRHKADEPGSLSYNYITAILEDNKGSLWIGTYNGLNRFNPESSDKPFNCFYSDPKNAHSLSNNLIWSFTQSNFELNTFWICTVDGLTSYNSKTEKFSRINLPESNLQFGNSVSSIVEQLIGIEKILWCGTYAGLIQINSSTSQTKRFVKEEYNQSGISSNYINRIIKDDSGVLWLATADNGLNYLSLKSMKFNAPLHLTGEKSYNKKLEVFFNKNINAINSTVDGTLWLGCDNGLYCIRDFVKGEIDKYYPHTEGLNIWSLAPGFSNDLWIGTYGQGLWQLDAKTGKLKSWNIEDPGSSFKNLSFNFVKSILQDNKGMLWIGFWGPGLTRLNPKNGNYQNWQNKENDNFSLSYNDVWVVYQDSRNRIWIGTNGGGLNLFDDREGGKFYCWSKGEREFGSLSDNRIYSIYESANRQPGSKKDETVLWIGTGAGLNKFIIKKDVLVNSGNNQKPGLSDLKAEIRCYTSKDGLPDNAVNSILEDDQGDLWIGTNAGISFFNVVKNKFTNYTTSDGLIGKDFKNAAFRTPNDLMFFGSNAGLNVFDPKGIRQSDYFPHIYITGFQIFNQPVPVGKESPLKTNITQAKEILLSYNQNVFSFQFSSLDYNSPQSNQYAYMMEGFDDDWIFSGSRRFVTYTNLDPGKYIFKVKATNSDGIWSKNEASLKVIIIPPWWKTAWAYSLYIFLIIAGVLGIRKFQINRAELRNELKMSEFEAKKHQELENLKSRFFANLSHEFRTPLMLIKGPVEQLLSSKLPQKLSENRRLAAEDEIEQLKMVRRNAQKLQELIDQLLELSQLEASSIPLKARQENLITLLHGMVSGFELLANQKNIKLVFHAGADTICAWVDNDKLEKIINNLLSNAFKFTQPGGTVAVLVQQNEKTEEAEIKITDTGIGIPDDHLNKIFNRFYQVDDSSRREFGGSGIGLSLVKELVDLHKWKISVRSEPGKGTEFSIKIPLSNSYLEEEEKIFEIQPGITGPKKNESGLNQILQEKSSDYAAGKILSENINNLAGISKDSSGRPLILIVEDSDDVRKYLIDILKSVYNLAEAENGEEGLRLTIEKMPDLILSDVMMPKMDGMEFCHRIKSNWETSHIPVIMLTAKASTENRLEGLETGADDYLTKPFDTKELYIRIRNLLEQHRRLREKFSKDINISAGTLAVNKADNEFLRKAFAVTEKNVSNADFNSEMFASEMYVSRSQLHRKLIAVTGEAPGEFIRSIRLKFAARLLLEKNLSVTQIALEVGFSSPSHFTKAFQLQFGCLPSEFKSRV